MARSRKRVEGDSPETKAAKSELSEAFAGFRKVYGDSTIRTGREIAAPVRISTGAFILDFALLGGIPSSRVSMVVGHRHSGKSMISYKIMGNAQKQFADQSVVLLDIEGTHDSTWSEKLGVDIDLLHVAECETGEMAVDIADAVLGSAETSLVVVDSLAALTPMKEIDDSAEDAHVGLQARLISRMVRKVTSSLIRERKRRHFPTLFFVNQFRCLDVDTMVWLDRGMVPLSDVRVGDRIETPDGFKTVEAMEFVGLKDGVEVTARGLPAIAMSNEHRHFIVGRDGFPCEVFGADIQEDDWVIVKASGSGYTTLVDGDDRLNPDIDSFLGAYFADGCVTKAHDRTDYRVSIAAKDEDRKRLVTDLMYGLFNGKGSYTHACTIGLEGVRLVDEMGVGRKGLEKCVPERIRLGGRSRICNFLQYASFDTHSFTRNKFYWTFETEEQASEFFSLLRAFDVRADVVNNRKGERTYLRISDTDARMFSAAVGFAEDRKERVVFEETRDGARGKYDVVPRQILNAVFGRARRRRLKGLSDAPEYSALNAVWHNGGNASRERLLRFAEWAKNQDESFAQYAVYLDIFRFCKVQSVREVSRDMVDLQVEGEVFIAAGQLTHNSKIGGFQKFGEPLSIPGGKALEFSTSVQFEMKNKENAGKDEYGIESMERNEHVFKIMKNKVNQGPRTGEFVLQRVDDSDSFLKAGDIDDSSTMLAYAKKFGFYSGGGKKWTLEIYEDSYTFGNQNEAVIALRQDPDMYYGLRDFLIKVQAHNQGMPESFIETIRSYYEP